jgi:hypothetical protein
MVISHHMSCHMPSKINYIFGKTSSMMLFCACGTQFAASAWPILWCDIIFHAIAMILVKNHQQRLLLLFSRTSSCWADFLQLPGAYHLVSAWLLCGAGRAADAIADASISCLIWLGLQHSKGLTHDRYQGFCVHLCQLGYHFHSLDTEVCSRP